jgi:hypothetical protein
MTDLEQLMYLVLGKISASKAPIVFKGALITKLVLAENGCTDLNRPTVDIDANWVGTPPTMDDLVVTIQTSLGELREQFYAVAIRDYEDKKSAGISIRTKSTDKEIMSMDISIKPVVGSKVYQYGEIGIRGVLPTEILADKITVLSKHLLFRRSKDFIDVYALTHCVKVLTAEIFEVISEKHLELGEFAELFTRRNDVEHAYDKLKGIDGKPPFDEVYPYLLEFVRPFAQRDKTPRVWNSGKQAWDDLSRMVDKRPSVLAQLRAAERELREHPAHPPKKTKHQDEPER